MALKALRLSALSRVFLGLIGFGSHSPVESQVHKADMIPKQVIEPNYADPNRGIIATTTHTPPTIHRGFLGLVFVAEKSGKTIELSQNEVVIQGANSLGESPLAFVARLLTGDTQAYDALNKLAKERKITVSHDRYLGTTDFSIGNQGLLFSRDGTFRTA